MQLIVLGMHRSGTSMLARMLNLMGVYFGPEGISTGANAENPKGFWERRDVRVLNDAVLHAMGCDWNRVSEFDPARIPGEVRDQFLKHARRLVLEMDAHRPWMIKEPRLCLLLPLWQQVFESPLCIHVWRNPIEVASSLRTRNTIPIEAGLALWEAYTLHAMRSSKALPSIHLAHQDLIRDTENTQRKLLKALRAHGIRGLRQPSHAEVDNFVDPKLYRERAGRSDLTEYSQSPQVQLFQTMMTTRGGPAKAVKEANLSQESRATLQAYEATLPPLVRQPFPDALPTVGIPHLQAKLKAHEKLVEELQQLQAKRRADIHERDRRIADLERDRHSLDLRAKGLEDDLKHQMIRVATRDQGALELERQLAELKGESQQRETKLRAEIHEQDKRIAGVERERNSLDVRAKGLENEVKDLKHELQTQRDQLRTSQESVQLQLAELSKRGEGIRELQQKLEDITSEARSLEKEASTAWAGRITAEQHLQQQLEWHVALTRAIVGPEVD